jgi:hypothetical protein
MARLYQMMRPNRYGDCYIYIVQCDRAVTFLSDSTGKQEYKSECL